MFDVAKLVNPFVQITNPNITLTWLQNAGYSTDATGHRTPIQTSSTIQGQIQALSAGDIKHLDALNIENVSRAVYMFGNVQGVVRADQKGGDTLQFAEIPGGTVQNWLVTVIFETWPTWSRVGVTLQNP